MYIYIYLYVGIPYWLRISDIYASDIGVLCLEYRISALNLGSLCVEYRMSMLRISDIFAEHIRSVPYLHPRTPIFNTRFRRKVAISKKYEIDNSRMGCECKRRVRIQPNIPNRTNIRKTFKIEIGLKLVRNAEVIS